MKIRFLGHSCIEIIGYRHIVIDPDFITEPEPGVEYICITHGHKDHIGRLAEIPTGVVVASPDVCQVAMQMGVSQHRMRPMQPGEQIANIRVLPGYSQTRGFFYRFLYFLLYRRKPEPATTPLSFLILDEASLLHIGDAHEAPLNVKPDILCLPWRKAPLFTSHYKKVLVRTARQLQAPYVIPIHHDMPATITDTSELRRQLKSTILDEKRWYSFHQQRLETD